MKYKLSAIIYLYLEWEISVAVSQPKVSQETTKLTIRKGMVMELVLLSTSTVLFIKPHSGTKLKKLMKKKLFIKQISKLERAQPIQVK